MNTHNLPLHYTGASLYYIKTSQQAQWILPGITLLLLVEHSTQTKESFCYWTRTRKLFCSDLEAKVFFLFARLIMSAQTSELSLRAHSELRRTWTGKENREGRDVVSAVAEAFALRWTDVYDFLLVPLLVSLLTRVQKDPHDLAYLPLPLGCPARARQKTQSRDQPHLPPSLPLEVPTSLTQPLVVFLDHYWTISLIKVHPEWYHNKLKTI